jgi:tyrosine-protein phosphatase OCA6
MAARPPLVPPLRFATVDEGVYRGAYPSLANFRFLRRLQLRTIVSLLPDQPSADLLQFCAHEQIAHHYLPTEKSEPAGLSVAAVADVLKLTMLEENLPLLVHCMDGFVTTGAVIMCMRKLQLWTSAVAQIEFGRFSRVRGEQLSSPTPAQAQFVEAFPMDQVLAEFMSQQEHEGRLSAWCARVALVNREGAATADAGGDGLGDSPAHTRQPRRVRRTTDGTHGFSSSIEALSLEGLLIPKRR